jgi:hypothetical protein
MQSSSAHQLAYPGGHCLSEAEIDDIYSTGMDTGGLDFSGADLSLDQPYQIADLLISNKLVPIVHVDLSCAKLSQEGMDALFVAVMEIKSIESFVCRNVGLTAQAGMSVSRLLSSKGCLRILDVSENTLGDAGVANLSGAFSMDHTKALQKQCISVMTLTVLDLSYNSVTDVGVVALCRGLSQLLRRTANVGLSLALKVLRLSHNNIGDKAALCLAQLLNTPITPTNDRLGGLRSSQNGATGATLELEELCLDGNPITVRGIAALLPCASDGYHTPLQRLLLGGTTIVPDVLLHVASVLEELPARNNGRKTGAVPVFPMQVDLGVSVEGALHLILGNYARTDSGHASAEEPVAVLCDALKRLAAAIEHTGIPEPEISLGALHSTLFNYAAHLQGTRDSHNAELNDAQIAHVVSALSACNAPAVAKVLNVQQVPNVAQWVRSAEYVCDPRSAVYKAAALTEGPASAEVKERHLQSGTRASDENTAGPHATTSETRRTEEVTTLSPTAPTSHSAPVSAATAAAPGPASLPAPAPASAPAVSAAPAVPPMRFQSTFLSTFKSTLGDQGLLGGPPTIDGPSAGSAVPSMGAESNHLQDASALNAGTREVGGGYTQAGDAEDASAINAAPMAPRFPAADSGPNPPVAGTLASALSSAAAELRTLADPTMGGAPVPAGGPSPALSRVTSVSTMNDTLIAEEQRFLSTRSEHTVCALSNFCRYCNFKTHFLVGSRIVAERDA